VFEKAVRKLRGRVMPPPGARQPDAAAADSLVAWLEETLDHAGASAPSHLPDQVVLFARTGKRQEHEPGANDETMKLMRLP